jgi:hypothetical protein
MAKDQSETAQTSGAVENSSCLPTAAGQSICMIGRYVRQRTDLAGRYL